MSSINSINSVGGGNYATLMQGMQRKQRPDPAEMAANLFSRLDTSGQGYIEKSDLATALGSAGSTTGATDSASAGSAATDVDELFGQLDGDGDGKVTQQEFADLLAKVGEQLESQAMNGRLQRGDMPPPPPPEGEDAGFTQEELTSQLEELGASDSPRASLIASIVDNFEAADSDGDGRVNRQEAMAFDQSRQTAAGSTGTTSDGATAATADETASSALSAGLLRQIGLLLRAYAPDANAVGPSSISVSA